MGFPYEGFYCFAERLSHLHQGCALVQPEALSWCSQRHCLVSTAGEAFREAKKKQGAKPKPSTLSIYTDPNLLSKKLANLGEETALFSARIRLKMLRRTHLF